MLNKTTNHISKNPTHPTPYRRMNIVKQVIGNNSLSADGLQRGKGDQFPTGLKCRSNSGPFLLGSPKNELSQTREVLCS